MMCTTSFRLQCRLPSQDGKSGIVDSFQVYLVAVAPTVFFRQERLPR